MTTKLSCILRSIRLKHGEVLYDMARKLDISNAQLSSMELGKTDMPADIVGKICRLYELSLSDELLLQRAVFELNKNDKKYIYVDNPYLDNEHRAIFESVKNKRESKMYEKQILALWGKEYKSVTEVRYVGDKKTIVTVNGKKRKVKPGDIIKYEEGEE